MNEPELRNLFAAIWKQFPVRESTMSDCANLCGESARGGGKCKRCLYHELADVVGRDYAETYIDGVKSIRDLETLFIDRLENP